MALRERAKHYRELSGDAERAALGLPPGDLRDGWMKIARDWVDLAEDVERALGIAPAAEDKRAVPEPRPRPD